VKLFNQLQIASPDEFKRLTGISKEDFDILYRKVADYIQSQKAIKPLRKRGVKSSKLLLEDCIILTLYYLRHYPTEKCLLAIVDPYNNAAKKYSAQLKKVKTITKPIFLHTSFY